MRTWKQRVVPLRVLLVRVKVQGLHLLLADLHSSFITSSVQNRFDMQSLVRFRGADHVDHGLETNQGLAPPVHADVGEHAVLDLVPLARSRRIVTDYNL